MKHCFRVHRDISDQWLEVPISLFKTVCPEFIGHYGSRMTATQVFLILKPDAMSFLYTLARHEWVVLPKLGVTTINDFPNVEFEYSVIKESSDIRNLPPLTRKLTWPLDWQRFDHSSSPVRAKDLHINVLRFFSPEQQKPRIPFGCY